MDFMGAVYSPLVSQNTAAMLASTARSSPAPTWSAADPLSGAGALVVVAPVGLEVVVPAAIENYKKIYISIWLKFEMSNFTDIIRVKSTMQRRVAAVEDFILVMSGRLATQNCLEEFNRIKITT